MAQTLSGHHVVKRYTLGTAGTALQVNLPERTRSAFVYFETNVGKFAFTGTDSVAIGSDYGLAQPNQWGEIPCLNMPALYFAGSTVDSTVLEIYTVGEGP
jgi:hypothetical protein